MKTGKKLSLCALLILLQPFCIMFGMKRSSPDSPAPDCIEQSPLHHAAWHGNTATLARLVKTHDCNQPIGPWGATPLFITAQEGHAAIAQQLLAAGANPNIATPDDGATPLYVAAQNGHTEAVKLLLAAGADKDKARITDSATPLYVAAQNGHAPVVKLLLYAGADKDKARTNGATPLLIAAGNGHALVVQQLLNAGADINKAMTDNGITPLYIAAHNGHAPVVDLLLYAGADKDKATTDNGETPLCIAAGNGHAPVVKLLVDAGADKDKAMTNGATPLFIAAEHGRTPVVDLLLAAGADKDKAMTDGETPLFIAAHNGHTAVVQLLLANGANPNIATTGTGATSLHVSAEAGHIHISFMLLCAGANEQSETANLLTPLHYARPEGTLRRLLEQWPTRKAPTLQLLAEIAINRCPIERLQELVRGGACLNAFAVEHNMATPLCLAACNGNPSLMRELLRLGAMPMVTDAHGCTPVHYAAQTPILLGLFGMIAIEQKPAKSRKEKQLHMQEFIEYWNPKFRQSSVATA